MPTTTTTTKSLDDEVRNFRETDDDLLAENNSFDNNKMSTSNEVADTYYDDNVKTDDTTSSNDNNGPLHPYHFVPLRMGGNGRTHVATTASAALIIDELGGLPPLERMTNAFYGKAFRDKTLDQFIRSHSDPHGSRFARWIHQKLAGGTLWDEDRAARSDEPVEVANGHGIVVHDRTSAHVAAWHSPKRPSKDVGRHFDLDECRVWMRLHFWAMRECGLANVSPAFADYYVRFIGHFVNVYERSAPAFARDSYRWSANPENIQKYIDDGYEMKEVLGLSLGKALEQIPEEEANDDVWPYHPYEEEKYALEDW